MLDWTSRLEQSFCHLKDSDQEEIRRWWFLILLVVNMMHECKQTTIWHIVHTIQCTPCTQVATPPYTALHHYTTIWCEASDWSEAATSEHCQEGIEDNEEVSVEMDKTGSEDLHCYETIATDEGWLVILYCFLFIFIFRFVSGRRMLWRLWR